MADYFSNPGSNNPNAITPLPPPSTPGGSNHLGPWRTAPDPDANLFNTSVRLRRLPSRQQTPRPWRHEGQLDGAAASGASEPSPQRPSSATPADQHASQQDSGGRRRSSSEPPQPPQAAELPIGPHAHGLSKQISTGGLRLPTVHESQKTQGPPAAEEPVHEPGMLAAPQPAAAAAGTGRQPGMLSRMGSAARLRSFRRRPDSSGNDSQRDERRSSGGMRDLQTYDARVVDMLDVIGMLRDSTSQV